MKRVMQFACALACCTVVAWTASAADTRSDETSAGAPTHRASKLIGMNVRNNQGEKIGSVDDLVVDMKTGRVTYLALGFGGILGLGEKLFAVPMNQVAFEHGSNENYFVLNASKEQLKAAPGFDKNHWPNMADPNWSKHIDEYYKQAGSRTTTTTTVKTKEEQR